jgi:hypothetical protein
VLSFQRGRARKSTRQLSTNSNSKANTVPGSEFRVPGFPSTNQRINKSTHQQINESTNQRINPSTHQRINESTHQPINKTTF